MGLRRSLRPPAAGRPWTLASSELGDHERRVSDDLGFHWAVTSRLPWEQRGELPYGVRGGVIEGIPPRFVSGEVGTARDGSAEMC